MILHKLTKKYAKGFITFEEDLITDNSGWIIDIKKTDKKGTKIQHTIIKKDIDKWIEKLLKENWKLDKK